MLYFRMTYIAEFREAIDMKRFKMFYVIVMILNLILVFTKGFSANLLIYSYNDANKGIRDGFQGDVSLSIINCFIIAIIIILTIITTLNKNNKIKVKWLFGLVTIIFALCIPIGIHSYSGGIMGIIDEENMYLWNIVFSLAKLISAHGY